MLSAEGWLEAFLPVPYANCFNSICRSLARVLDACPQVAIAAKEHNVPVYVAAESYKFARCTASMGQLQQQP